MTAIFTLSNPIFRATYRNSRAGSRARIAIGLSLLLLIPLWLLAPGTVLPDVPFLLVKYAVFVGVMSLPLVSMGLCLLWLRPKQEQITLIANTALSQRQIVMGYLMSFIYQTRILLLGYLLLPMVLIPTIGHIYPARLADVVTTVVWCVGTQFLLVTMTTTAIIRWRKRGYHAAIAMMMLLVVLTVVNAAASNSILADMLQYDFTFRLLTASRGLSGRFHSLVFVGMPWIAASFLIMLQAGIYHVSVKMQRLGVAVFIAVAALSAAADAATTVRIKQERQQVRVRLTYYSDIGDLYTQLKRRGWLYDGTLKGADIGLQAVAYDLHRVDLRQANIYGVALSDANLRFADLRGATFGNAQLQGADLSHADLTGASLPRSTLAGARLDRVRVTGADLRDVDFNGAQLRDMTFADMRMFRADFADAQLESVDFSDVDLYNTNFTGATLTNTTFDSNTILPDRTRWQPTTDMAQFTDRDHPDFWAGYIARANLPIDQLSGLNLRNASMGAAEFKGANMSEADLWGANFRGSDLRNVDFSRAYLNGAELAYTNLQGAQFADSDLTRADFTRAVVSCSQLEVARTLTGVTLPDGTVLSDDSLRQQSFAELCQAVNPSR